jgi:transposase
LLAELITKKFADHLPLYRISDSLAREDIHISRQILCQWVMRAGKALKPLYEEMRKQVIESGNVFMDESPINMQDPGKGKVHQAYMWVLVGGKSTDPPYKIYNFRTDRKHSHAKELLQGYQGVLHSDKYGAYQSLAGNEAMVWCPCWAHIRRKFFEAEYGDPQFRQWILRKIRYLFLFERIAWARPPEERLRIRREKEVPIIDAITEAVKKKLREGSILPKSKFSEALGYYCGLIPQLKNYTEHAYARIDNNVAERAIRPLAIGRKNWLFVGNEEGGEVAGILFSLIQTCRGIGINPREYLEDIMRRLLDQPANKLYELLPDHWAAARSKSTVSPSSLI